MIAHRVGKPREEAIVLTSLFPWHLSCLKSPRSTVSVSPHNRDPFKLFGNIVVTILGAYGDKYR